MDQVCSAAIRRARALSQHPDHEKFYLFLTTIIEFEDYYVWRDGHIPVILQESWAYPVDLAFILICDLAVANRQRQRQR